MLLVRSHVNALFNSISYAIRDIIIDPGDEWGGFDNVSAVLLTHAHFDHIYGLNMLLNISPSTRVFTNEFGREMLLNARKNLSLYHETPFVFDYPDNIIIVNDGDEIGDCIGMKTHAILTPGHNPSCITWCMEDVIFTGDSYIPGIKTVTNLPYSDRNVVQASEEIIKKLASGRIIYPGHKN